MVREEGILTEGLSHFAKSVKTSNCWFVKREVPLFNSREANASQDKGRPGESSLDGSSAVPEEEEEGDGESRLLVVDAPISASFRSGKGKTEM
mgnify:CR=1 FL=1